jgi:TonB family protein
MAHQPLLRSDFSHLSGESSRLPSEADDLEVRETRRHMSELTGKLAAHTHGTPPGELALDLVLHEIVEQAQLATTSTGAAIAVVRDDELICRATSGSSAPDLGVRLTTSSGLSGACLRTRKAQQCDDASTDPRVDPEACRALDVSSILIVPLLDEEILVGIFAIFASRTHAYGERDVRTLQAFSRRIVQSIRQASEPPEIAAADRPEAVEANPDPGPAEVLERAMAPLQSGRDFWMDALSVAIVALTLLLGWLVGRAGWKQAILARRNSVAAAASQPPTSRPAPVAEGTPAPVTVPPPKKPATSTAPPAGGMVVYENGKVVFRMPPAEKGPIERASDVAPLPTSGSSDSSLTLISPEVAEALLVHRVEPQYPDDAKQARVQGDVVLETVIGADGAVRGMTALSGDSRLASVAMDAVRQWRYQPYLKNGHAVDVQTRITLRFALP